MSDTRGTFVYRYRDAVNGFFEFPTDNARTILPPGLQPIEPHHGQSVLAVTAFEFHESLVGPYKEVVLSVLVSPRVLPHEPMPRAAMYPFMVGTTTPESRKHGMEQWLLPHYPRDLDVVIQRTDGRVVVTASDGAGPILDLTVTEPADMHWQPAEHRYQTFSLDGSGLYLSALTMAGPFLEHEEETGNLTLHDHAFNASVDRDTVNPCPFREQWMKQGTETIFPLQPLAALAGR